MSEIGPKTIEPFVGPIDNDSDEPIPVCVDGIVKIDDTYWNRSWGTATTAIQNIEAQRIAPSNPKRRALVILNTGTVTINLLETRSAVGFPLAPGASVTMEHQDPVFASAPTATPAVNATLALMWENKK